MKRSLILASSAVLTFILGGFTPSPAENDMPMGGQKVPSQPATVRGRASLKTRTNMSMLQHQSHHSSSVNSGMPGMMKPMSQTNSQQPGTMSGGMPEMMKPMSQTNSQQPAPIGGGMPGGRAAPDASEHAKHHPAGAGGGMGAMMSGMGSMMAPAPVANPNTVTVLPLAQDSLDDQVRIEQLANTRMDDGTALMTQGIVSFSQARPKNDLAVMVQSTEAIRNGLSQVESGLAAKRMMSEGTPSREIALTWFKQEMTLTPTEQGKDIFGVSWFHFFVMFALTIFSGAMIWMYFFKMRRAAEVLSRVIKSDVAGASEPVAANPAPPTATKSAPPSVEPAGARTTAPIAAAPATIASAPPGPVAGGWKGILRVNRIFDETPGVKTFRFTAMDGGPIPFAYVPGQYLSVFPMIDGKRTPRSYTMASSPTQRYYCELTIKREEHGSVSTYLHDGLQEGELLEASGPTGTFTFTGVEAKNIVLIAGGVGITPFMSAVRYLTDSGWAGEIYLLYTCRHESDFIFRAELEQLCTRHPSTVSQ